MKFTYSNFEPIEFKVDKKELAANNISDEKKLWQTTDIEVSVGTSEGKPPMLSLGWFYIVTKDQTDTKPLVHFAVRIYYLIEDALDYNTPEGELEIDKVIHGSYVHFKGVFDQNKMKIPLRLTMIFNEADVDSVKKSIIKNIQNKLEPLPQ